MRRNVGVWPVLDPRQWNNSRVHRLPLGPNWCWGNFSPYAHRSCWTRRICYTQEQWWPLMSGFCDGRRTGVPLLAASRIDDLLPSRCVGHHQRVDTPRYGSCSTRPRITSGETMEVNRPSRLNRLLAEYTRQPRRFLWCSKINVQAFTHNSTFFIFFSSSSSSTSHTFQCDELCVEQLATIIQLLFDPNSSIYIFEFLNNEFSY